MTVIDPSIVDWPMVIFGYGSYGLLLLGAALWLFKVDKNKGDEDNGRESNSNSGEG